MRLFAHLRSLIRFSSLPPEHRRLTFYSEGANYWVHLERLVTALLEYEDLTVNYVSSDPLDPGLQVQHPNFRAFEIDEGSVRNWFFENLQTEVMVMTMPDLHQYQVKRSKHPVHYVYVQHSLVSLHMIYRKGAFDHFDTIFCSGPHHLEEVRALEALYDLPQKVLVEHGYGRLDAIREAAAAFAVTRAQGDLRVVIAPSWGPNGLVESGLAATLVDHLLTQGNHVTLRPHPQTTRLAPESVKQILDKHGTDEQFEFEGNVAGQDSLHLSDVMISDWSGAALDYAYGLEKPVVFIDVPRKVNNTEYEQLGITPFEVSVREQIGFVVQPEDIDLLDLTEMVEQTRESSSAPEVFNVGTSGRVGAEYLHTLLRE